MVGAGNVGIRLFDEYCTKKHRYCLLGMQVHCIIDPKAILLIGQYLRGNEIRRTNRTWQVHGQAAGAYVTGVSRVIGILR